MTNETHNIWTLTKHVAGSVNKAAGHLDKVIYNPEPPSPSWFDLHPVLGGIAAIGIAILGVLFLIALCAASKNEKGQVRPQWWWFTP